MRCIFCKNDSSNSKSIEHIVPESLGNKSHVLPLGIVCDSCNQYFSTKIEKKLLEQPFFKDLRHRNLIESKKGKIPKGTAYIPETNSLGEVIREKNNNPIINVDTDSYDEIQNGKVNRILILHPTEPEKDNRSVSRFICKIAFEAMAKKFLKYQDALDYLINETQFDPIRNYVRYDRGTKIWKYNYRKIYQEDENFIDNKEKITDILFEYDFLRTERSEYYFIIILKGYEFVINIGGEPIDGYTEWLEKNEFKSPLYMKKHDTLSPRFNNKNNAP